MADPTALDTLRAALLADNQRDRELAATHARLAEEQPDDRSASFAEHRVQGIAGGVQPMTARTRHDWTLVETGERYVRLRRFAVTALRPFTPVSAEEALAEHGAAQAA